ncbi:conserved membrane protein of unknown function [Tenacibaculum sp. 190130A14a]|uniref:PAP2 superfamily protein n=1 Tax=Tenacibaculum polynesiense TaxID=3137857 RepID=A0ABP1EWL5_9FLAO
MNWQKLISTVLHPIVMPTIGLLLFLLISDLRLNQEQKLVIFSIVFIATYIIPLLLLILLKGFGLIKSYQVSTINERKIPLFLMTVLFFSLGKMLMGLPMIRDFALLFYGTMISLIIVYFLFLFKIKSSLHLLSMGASISFFLLIDAFNQRSIIFSIVVLLFVLSGILGRARLDLKAHTVPEIYIGFFLGFIGQVIAFSFL